MNGVIGPRQDLDDLLESRPPTPKPRGRVIVMPMALAQVVTGAVTTVQMARAATTVQHLGDCFAAIPAAERPTAAPTAASAPASPMNVLVIGSDSRAPNGDTDDWTHGGQHSGVLAVLHLSADHANAQCISILHDSWVPVHGYGSMKIDAAYSSGSARLTVEQPIELRIDHVVAIDLVGFALIHDTLQSVDICVPKTVTDASAPCPPAAPP